jgi:UDP-glucose 4-epimerase
MRVAVTGGSGFIGSHIVDYLKQAGHDVLVIDHRVKPHRSDVEFADVDIVDFAALLSATEGCEFIYHLAAVSNVDQAFQQPVYTVELNVRGTANVLETARRNHARRVVLASTVWVYSGCRDHEVHEDSPFYMPGAGHIYTSSKIASELLCQDYWRLYQQPFTIFRYDIPYGPRLREATVIPTFLRKAFNGEPLTIIGDGSQHRNFVYVEDLARAHVLAMQDAAQNQIYNLKGKRRITVRELAETINALLGGDIPIEHLPARPGDYGGKEVSGAKARRELGWSAEIDFEEGMRRTIAWFAEKHGLTLPKPTLRLVAA